ncbi:MAG: ribosome biogenesis GTPase YlqF [Lachnospiraceae bacterium]|nr:ribosome biogenesis GTPase YlqF [Lachnospiraceae bacterium]
MNIQWYPGHMTKARRMMQDNIKLIDIVIELLDARVPVSSRNPDIDQLANNKYRLVILNKCDLADDSVNDKWKDYFSHKGIKVITINARSGQGMKNITDIVKEACKEKIERDRKRGIINRPIRAMIVGIPNVGKSTFINSYAKKACTKVGNKPGVTKGKQWIKINKNVELLDTPGILWPKFEDETVGKHLAFIGSINDDILQKTELACELISFLISAYPGVLEQRYEADETLEAPGILEGIAKNRGCILKGEELDYDKAASILLDEFRGGVLGRISIETPVDNNI